MARIRTIKPEFWRHPVMARLDDDIQLLALSLLTMADDEGYFRAEPALIRGDVQPFRENLPRISRGLEELVQAGWIEVAKHPEQGDIGRVREFAKHQRVHNPTPSKLSIYFARELLGKSSGDSTEKIPLEQGTGNREQGTGECARELLGKSSGESDTPPPSIPPDGMHSLNYAAKVIEVLGMVHSKQNAIIIAAAVDALAKTGMSKPAAAEFLTARALDDRDEGISIDKFWFEDSKWNRGSQGNGKLTPEDITNREIAIGRKRRADREVDGQSRAVL